MRRVYADFQNTDAIGRVRLNCAGTQQDLARETIQLTAGLKLSSYSDDCNADGTEDELRAVGVVEYSGDERGWVAVVDPATIHHASDESLKADERGPMRNAS